MTEEKEFTYEINMEKLENYKFLVDFGRESIPSLLMDETKDIPGGEETGPTASMLMGAAVGNCLSASLVFCLSKKRVNLENLKTKITLKRKRNDKGYWSISEIVVDLQPEIAEEDRKRFDQCVEIFRNYCIVSNSIETGIPLTVNI
ncbi:MAG: OsmC family protein [Candidatus Heimdallarchaeota archaeon]|nr:OsmC family protein [Candidatus Heimdallarchaeota archaeon]